MYIHIQYLTPHNCIKVLKKILFAYYTKLNFFNNDVLIIHLNNPLNKYAMQIIHASKDKNI